MSFHLLGRVVVYMYDNKSYRTVDCSSPHIPVTVNVIWRLFDNNNYYCYYYGIICTFSKPDTILIFPYCPF